RGAGRPLSHDHQSDRLTWTLRSERRLGPCPPGSDHRKHAARQNKQHATPGAGVPRSLQPFRSLQHHEWPGMPKTTTVTAAILTLLTGLALGHLGSLAMPRLQPVPPASAVSAQELETARSFYDGLNHFVSTGEPGVESMLALDFVDYMGSQ